MKKLLLLLLITPLFLAVAKSDDDDDNKSVVKSRSAHEKAVRNHEQNWNQPHYDQHITLYHCRDSWGNKIRGRFSEEQQYFIELGGGYCQRLRRERPDRHSEFTPLLRENFPLEHVYHAIDQINRKYRLYSARVVKTYDVDAGYKTLQYTIAFKTDRQQYREFRIKHNRWNGEVRSIREV